MGNELFWSTSVYGDLMTILEEAQLCGQTLILDEKGRESLEAPPTPRTTSVHLWPWT